jgi:hypothetical protein
MQTVRMNILAGVALAALAGRAEAQAGPYKLQEINFDMWCQEERHLPPERCDKRLPADDADYQAYVAKIEHYEVPYLQRRQDEDTLNRVILHNDPVDHPTEPSAPPVNQPPPQN